MQITPHFKYKELVYTNHNEFKLANFEQGKEFIGNMRMLCHYLLEPIRIRYGVPVLISSCFRSLKLHYYLYDKINSERQKKGLQELPVPLTSQHLKAEAVDFIVKSFECKKIFDFIRFQDYLKYGQLIWENRDNKEWIHCSLPTLENNGQVLIFENGSYRRLK